MRLLCLRQTGTVHVNKYMSHMYKWLHILHVHRYASERIGQLEARGKLTQCSRWTPLTLPEMNGFLSIILNMGVIKAPEIEDYWKTTMES